MNFFTLFEDESDLIENYMNDMELERDRQLREVSESLIKKEKIY